MKKIISIVLCVAMVACMLLATSCSKPGKTSYKIGICQLVAHPALDAATQGFKDAIVAAFGAENVEFIEQNAAGSTDTCATIASTLVSQKCDAILANATPALQACASATLSIPVFGTSITDYASALDIKNWNGTVGGNVSGTTDLAPLDQQAAMVKELFPDAKTVGILYCSAEANSVYQVETITPMLEKLGLTVTKYVFTDSNDVAAVTANAMNNDVMYVPTDNTAASCAETINGANTKNTPIIAGEEGICTGCGVATLSISYYDLGYATGEMAVKVLKGEADINTLAIQASPKFTKEYNAAKCAEIGLTIPEGYAIISGTEVK